MLVSVHFSQRNLGWFDARTYGYKPDGKQLYDGAMTSGSATLTSATANFTGADVGKVGHIKGAATGELLIMPGETATLKWVPDRVGMFPFYCTDFCSALHQEMQGYARVSAAGSSVPISFSTGTNLPKADSAGKK